MKLTRAQFDKKFEEAFERLVEADAAMSNLMHRTPSRQKMRAALRETLTVEKCLCARPLCPGWVVKRRKDRR